jgi:hypothetical protein
LSLLAAREESRGVWGRFDHSRPGVGSADWSVMLGAAALLIVVVTYSIWRSRRDKREFLSNSSPKLFRELSRAHRLDRAHRKVMKKLAAASGAESAAVLFVEPEHFDNHKLPAQLASSAPRLRQLKHALFD